jgi:hypothetical protein
MSSEIEHESVRLQKDIATVQTAERRLRELNRGRAAQAMQWARHLRPGAQPLKKRILQTMRGLKYLRAQPTKC